VSRVPRPVARLARSRRKSPRFYSRLGEGGARPSALLGAFRDSFSDLRALLCGLRASLVGERASRIDLRALVFSSRRSLVGERASRIDLRALVCALLASLVGELASRTDLRASRVDCEGKLCGDQTLLIDARAKVRPRRASLFGKDARPRVESDFRIDPRA